jgi:hypothetical protein
MSPIDDDLKNALRRQYPPQGFADRVLARLAEESSSRSSAAPHDSLLLLFTRPFVRWATAAALASALVAGGVYYRQVYYVQVQYRDAQRERAEGEAAKQRLMLALRIAGSKLQLAKSRVNEINANQTGNREEKE